MLLKENCLRKETRVTGKGVRYKIYIYNCLGCGKELSLQAGSLKTHSCKCRSCTQKGEEYLFIYNELKNHRNRKVEFTLSFEEFKEIILHNECTYCGKELVYNKYSKNWGKNFSRAHQLDRKDNLKGYTIDNVAPCCWTCNRLKSDIFSYEDFMKLAPALKEIRISKEITK
jgi:hypothetical protein